MLCGVVYGAEHDFRAGRPSGRRKTRRQDGRGGGERGHAEGGGQHQKGGFTHSCPARVFQFIEGVKAEDVAVFCLQLHMLVFHDHAGDAVENNLQGALFASSGAT